MRAVFLIVWLLSGIAAVVHYESRNDRADGSFSDGDFIGVLLLNPVYWLSVGLTSAVKYVHNRGASKARWKESNGTASQD